MDWGAIVAAFAAALTTTLILGWRSNSARRYEREGVALKEGINAQLFQTHVTMSAAHLVVGESDVSAIAERLKASHVEVQIHSTSIFGRPKLRTYLVRRVGVDDTRRTLIVFVNGDARL